MANKYFIMLFVLLNTCTKKNSGDFNGLKWGDSQEKIIEREGAKPVDIQKDLYVYNKKLNGVPVQLGYIFVNNQLASAAYIPQDAGSMKDKIKATYLHITDSLTKIYGASQDTTLEDGTKFKKTWHTSVSNIYLYYYLESFLLTFTSKRFEPLINMESDPDPSDTAKF
jgi:hypothetical protein